MGWFQRTLQFDHTTSPVIAKPRDVWQPAESPHVAEGLDNVCELLSRALDAKVSCPTAPFSRSPWINFLRLPQDVFLRLAPAPRCCWRRRAYGALQSARAPTALEDALRCKALQRADSARRSAPTRPSDRSVLESRTARNSTNGSEMCAVLSLGASNSLKLAHPHSRISTRTALRDSVLARSRRLAGKHLPAAPIPPMFQPVTLRGLTLPIASSFADVAVLVPTAPRRLLTCAISASAQARRARFPRNDLFRPTHAHPGCAGMIARIPGRERIVAYVHALRRRDCHATRPRRPKGSTQSVGRTR